MGAGIFTPPSATTSGWEGMRKRPDRSDFPAQGAYDQAMIGYGGASAGKPTIKHTPSSWFNDGFDEKLKEQMAEMGADYDKADQPFRSLTPTTVGGQVPAPKPLMPSLMGGTPTGGSYNPYLKKKGAR